jgi:hypothetical protein
VDAAVGGTIFCSRLAEDEELARKRDWEWLEK